MKGSLEAQQESVRRQRMAAKPAAWLHEAPTPRGCVSPPMPELNRMIDRAARDNGLSPSLVREVVREESAFFPCAVSRAGAEGLMQLMPSVQQDLGVRDPFNPAQSLEAGTKLLKQLLGQFNGDLPLALGAYNAGAQTVIRSGGVPPIPETLRYVREILNRLQGPEPTLVPTPQSTLNVSDRPSD